jgi:hypothetical protein
MKKILFISIASLLLIYMGSSLSSCGAKKSVDNEMKEQDKALASTTSADLSTTGGFEKGTNKSTAQGNKGKDATIKDDKTPDAQNTAKEVADKVVTKIIKTADISMQVKNYIESRKAILAMVQANGGYVSSENQSNGTYSIVNDLEIRIKPEGFDNLVDRISAQAVFVDYKKITADDVTDEYVDAVARVKSKKEVEERYSEILKKANTISDILQVEEKLRNIREEIESYEGKLKYLNDQVSYSTIKVHFYEKLDYMPAPETGFGHKVGKAFLSGWHGFLLFLVGLVYAWPVWLIAGAIAWLMMRIIKRNKKKNVK